MPCWLYGLGVLWAMPLIAFGWMALRVWREDRADRPHEDVRLNGPAFRALEDQRSNPRRTGR